MKVQLTINDFYALGQSLAFYHTCLKERFRETGEQEFREELVRASFLENSIRSFVEEVAQNEGVATNTPTFTPEHVSTSLGALEVFQIVVVVMMRNEPENHGLVFIRESIIKLLSVFAQTGAGSQNLLNLYDN